MQMQFEKGKFLKNWNSEKYWSAVQIGKNREDKKELTQESLFGEGTSDDDSTSICFLPQQKLSETLIVSHYVVFIISLTEQDGCRKPCVPERGKVW